MIARLIGGSSCAQNVRSLRQGPRTSSSQQIDRLRMRRQRNSLSQAANGARPHTHPLSSSQYSMSPYLENAGCNPSHSERKAS